MQRLPVSWFGDCSEAVLPPAAAQLRAELGAMQASLQNPPFLLSRVFVTFGPYSNRLDGPIIPSPLCDQMDLPWPLHFVIHFSCRYRYTLLLFVIRLTYPSHYTLRCNRPPLSVASCGALDLPLP